MRRSVSSPASPRLPAPYNARAQQTACVRSRRPHGRLVRAAAVGKRPALSGRAHLKVHVISTGSSKPSSLTQLQLWPVGDLRRVRTCQAEGRAQCVCARDGTQSGALAARVANRARTWRMTRRMRNFDSLPRLCRTCGATRRCVSISHPLGRSSLRLLPTRHSSRHARALRSGGQYLATRAGFSSGP